MDLENMKVTKNCVGSIATNVIMIILLYLTNSCMLPYNSGIDSRESNDGSASRPRLLRATRDLL